jgi:ADP-ribose pyrophosphatase
MSDDVEVLEQTLVYAGYLKVYRYRLRHRRHAGGMSDVVVRELIDRGKAITVLPYDPVRDEVVLIEQFRIGAMGAGLAPFQVECVAGIIDPGETSKQVAERESMEEAGLRVRALARIGMTVLSPGVLSETATMYCGWVDAAGAGGIRGLPEEHEDIRVFALPFAEAMRRLDDETILLAPAIISLQWLRMNRDALRMKWR